MLMYIFALFCLFWDRVSTCSSSWPWVHGASLKLFTISFSLPDTEIVDYKYVAQHLIVLKKRN